MPGPADELGTLVVIARVTGIPSALDLEAGAQRVALRLVLVAVRGLRSEGQVVGQAGLNTSRRALSPCCGGCRPAPTAVARVLDPAGSLTAPPARSAPARAS